MNSMSVSEWVPVKSGYCDVDVAEFNATLRQRFNAMERLRKESHRVSMVAFRQNKKTKQKLLKDEHRRLEREMKLFLEKLRAVAAQNSSDRDTGDKTMIESVRELVAKRETLRRENIALREEIIRHEKFREVVLGAGKTFTENEKSTLLPIDIQSGWRVHFDSDVPSFHFHPFTRNEFDSGMKQFSMELERNASLVSLVGNFLGWNVHRAPLITSLSNNNSVLSRVQLSKRVHCPLDVFLRLSYAKEKDLSPTIITPIEFSIHERYKVSTQFLQEFDQDSLVFVHNIPGRDEILRYFYFVRRAQWQLQDGKRKLALSMMIADSSSNKHSRESDELQNNIEWATEGGISVSLTEVDETSIDIVCDRWADCHSKVHAEYMLIQWAQFANWWEQTVAPSSLLL